MMPGLLDTKIDPTFMSGLQLADIDVLKAASHSVHSIDRHQPLLPDKPRVQVIAVVLDGWAGRINEGAERRHIFDFLLPGDLCGLEESTLGLPPANVRALTAAQVEYFDLVKVEALLLEHPSLSAGFLRHIVFQAATARVGQSRLRLRSAAQRLAGLIHDLVVRLCLRDSLNTCDAVIPLTQFDLADATGLTAIHVNRTLKEMRAGGLISIGNRRLCVDNWPGLCAAARIPDRMILKD